jgi:hypothetical protein
MPRRGQLDGWESLHGRGVDGLIESDERATAPHPVVSNSTAGAHHLGQRYWREVTRASHGIVRPRRIAVGVELRLFGSGPALLRLTGPETTVAGGVVSCRYRIAGGLLARVPGGELTLSQTTAGELRASVSGFVPRLNSNLYEQLQRRLHVAISRRYFRALIGEAKT